MPVLAAITALGGEKERCMEVRAQVTVDWFAEMDGKGLHGGALTQSTEDFIA